MIAGRAEQILAWECTCCRQLYGPNRSFDDAFNAAILGAEKYVVCPACELNVPDSMRTDGYKRRWRLAMEAHLQTEQLGLLVAISSLMDMGSNVETDELFREVYKRLQICYPDKTLPEMKVAGDRLRRFLRKQ
jgi:hypothetical protein